MQKVGWIICLLLWASLATAEEVMVVTEILPPWQTTEGTTVSGISTEIVEATLREADIEFKLKVYPWSRAYRIALERPKVLIYSIVRTPARENLFKWAGMIGSVKEHFFHLADREDIRLSTVQDAKKYVTIIPRDDFRHQFLISKGFKDKLEFHLVNNQEQALRMLYAGRGDLILDDELTLAYELRQFKLDPAKIKTAIHIPEMSVDFEMAFSKQTPDRLVNKVRTALKVIKANGLYHEIIKWHDLTPSPNN